MSYCVSGNESMKPGLWSRRYATLFFVWLTCGSFYLCRLNMSAVIPLVMEDLKISHLQVGSIMSSFFIAYALSLVPAGYLSDRFGSKRVITIAGLLSALSNFFFSRSTRLYHFFSFQILNGISQAGVGGASIKLVGDWFPKSGRATALGVLFSCVPAFTVISYWLSSFLGESFGWRSAFFVPFVILSCMALICFRVIRDSAEDEQSIQTGKDKGSDFPASTLSAASIKTEILSNRPLWLLGACLGGVTFIGYTYLMWLPTFLFETFDITIIKAGMFSSIYPLLGIPARFTIGWICDFYFHSRKKILIITALIGVTILCFILSNVSSFLWTILILSCIGFLVQLTVPLIFALQTDVTPRRFIGTGASFVNGIGSIGSIVAMVGPGFIIDMFHSYQVLFMILSGAALGAAISVFFVPQGKELRSEL